MKKFLYLLKYEFKYYFRILPALYGALIVFSGFAGLQELFNEKSGAFNGLFVLIWSGLLIAISVVSLVLLVQRFRENLLGAPGYLMLTLPVSAWTLTASKALAALCMSVLSGLVIAVSALLFSAIVGGESPINADTLRIISDYMAGKEGLLALAFVVSLVVIFHQICLFYALLAASCLLPRFRTVCAFIVYLGIMFFVEQPILNLASGGEAASVLGLDMRFLVTTGIITLIFGAVYFYLTGLLLKKTVNLD